MLEALLSWSLAATVVASVLLVTIGQRLPGALLPRIVWSAAVAFGALGIAAGRSDWALACAGSAIGAVAVVLPRRWTPVGAWFIAASIVLAVSYAIYLARATIVVGGGPVGLALGITLLLLEMGAIGLILAAAIEMVDALCSGPTPHQQPPPRGDQWPVVCLQVPTYNEPPDLVIETVRSLVALEGPPVRIQVIDNNTTDEDLWRPVQAECARLAAAGAMVRFVHLPEWPGYKAGALNWGRTNLDPDVEIVGVVDADYVVDPAWLRETVPWFVDPRVGFVQTPQDYRAWADSAFYRACYVGFAYFFKVGMVSRSRRNSIIFAGTMGLIRRSTLDAVGGWDERIITEDAEISLRVLARGERAVYVERAFGHGIMPLTYEGLRKQRFRWAFGGIQILRRHWRTIFAPRSGLTLGQRYDHLIGGLWWFNDALTFAFGLFVVATAVGVLTGRPFVVQRLTALGLVLPTALIGLNLGRYLWALRRATGMGPVLAIAALRVNLSLSWVIAYACGRGLVQEHGVFLRTPKFRGATTIRELKLVATETSLAVVALGLAALLATTRGLGPQTLPLVLLLLWMGLIYGSATSFALGDPTRAPIGLGLRQKMGLEVAPRVGQLARSRSARASVLGAAGAVLLVVILAAESGREPLAELPFGELPPPTVTFGGPPEVAADSSPSTSPSPEPSGTSVAPSGSPPASASANPTPGAQAATPTGADAQPSSAATPGPAAVATPNPTAAATARPSPPSAAPTPTPPVVVPAPAHSAPVTAPNPPPRPSQPPQPAPSIPPHP